jgi:hypothetical protein
MDTEYRGWVSERIDWDQFRPSQYRMMLSPDPVDHRPPTAQPFVADTIVIAYKSMTVGLGQDVQATPSQWRIIPFIPTAHPAVADTISTEVNRSVTGLLTKVQR